MLKKTVVIGLGGTGQKAVLYMKKKLIEIYGEDSRPPMIKFLVFDTTDKDFLESIEGDVKLSKGEFKKIEVRDPAALISSSEVKCWWPKGVPVFALHSGAKQVRALGRLAVFANSTELESSINGIINDVRDYRIGRSEKYEVISNSVSVNIVGSLAGGTGSGTLIDVAALVKKNLNSGAGDKLAGFFLLPDVFSSQPATENIDQNTFGALKEINYFFEDGVRERYKLGGSEIIIDQGLFNTVYIINNLNKRGEKYSKIEDLQEFIGMGMYLLCSTTGKVSSDVQDNIEAQIIGKKYFGKPTVYSSFGISELVLKTDWLAELQSYFNALNVIQHNFIGCSQNNIKNFTDEFIIKIGIQEHDADQVIDEILNSKDWSTMKLPAEITKENVNQILDKRVGHLQNVKQKLYEISKVNTDKLINEKTKALEKEIRERLSTPNGLEFCKTFLQGLRGRVSEFKNEMEIEKTQFVTEKKRIEEKYQESILEVQRVAKKIWGARPLLERSTKHFKELVDRDSKLIYEIERRERAIEFFVHFKDKIMVWIANLEEFTKICSILIKELHQESQKKIHERKCIKPFVFEMKVEEFGLENIDLGGSADFLKWLKENKKYEVPDLTEMSIEDVKNIFLEYGANQKNAIELKNKRIEEILSELTPDKRSQYIGKLDEMASPLWQYNQGLISGDKKTENIYLFGVEDASTSILTNDDLSNYIESNFEPNIVSTGDRNRITCFKVESAVPAFVILDMPKYREKYLSPDRPFSYHIHKDYDKKLPPLFPRTTEEDIRQSWSLALADPFNFITKISQYYYLKSEKKGKRTDDYQIKLAQGRSEAMQEFMDNSEFVDEVNEKIEFLIKTMGADKVVESLKSYQNELENRVKMQGKKVTKKIKEIIELELDDIDKFINEITDL